MGLWNTILMNLPEVGGPTQKRLSFKEKLKWTGIILVLFYALGLVSLFGLGDNQLEQFEILSMILGASFGSIISLGIGPLVTSSIVLQLLNGSGLVKFDLTSHEGKRNFQGVQKLLSFVFIIFEACIYVFMGGLPPPADPTGSLTFFQIELLIIFQLILGGVLIMFMDEVISKWGFGSGISLFIAAGVSQGLFIRTLSWLPSPANPEIPVGAIPTLFVTLGKDPLTPLLMLGAIASTVIVFVIAVYAQSMKIEIPLSFGRIRGHGIRWPLNFIYTSNIPVILVAALLANVQLWARLVQNWAESGSSKIVEWFSIYVLGQSQSMYEGHGILQWVNPPNVLDAILKGALTSDIIWRAVGYLLLMVFGCIVFGWFWVQTSGMDSKSQAKQIMASGLQIPGFRKDWRILERLLDRYINPLTVMGAVVVGLLSAIADLSGALTSGTGLLLTVMIVFKLYEEVAKQHMMDMNPMMRQFMGG